jgi:signal transduction histidine kinase
MNTGTPARQALVRLGQVAITFALFALFNLIGSWFEIEKGISILFPATAISVVCSMWFGPWAAIGVFLGTIATPWEIGSSPGHLAISGAICAIEGLIPWAFFRVRRDLAPDLRDIRSLGAFLLFGALINTGTSALLGTLFIIPHVAGTINLRGLFIWWISGFTASLLFATPVLAFGGQFLNPRSAAHRSRTLANAIQIVTTILLLGFVATFAIRTYLRESVERDWIREQSITAQTQVLLNVLHEEIREARSGPGAVAGLRLRSEATLEQLAPLMQQQPASIRSQFTRVAAETIAWLEPADVANRAVDPGEAILQLRAQIDVRSTELLKARQASRSRIRLVTTVLDGTVFIILVLSAVTLLVNVSRPFSQLKDALGSLRDGSLVDTARIEGPYLELRSVAAALSDASRTLLQREEQLKERTEAAVEASRHKTDFLAKMSHELRTPLNSILGFTELMMDQDATIQPQKRLTFLDNVNNSARHLLKLINDLLDIARIESGKFELHLEDVDLRYAIQNTVASTSPLFARKKQQLDMELPDEPLLVRCDLGRIEQVLLNLLSNANKFSGEGQRVTIRGSADADICTIEVADHGIGIPSEHRARIFEEFEQIQTKGGEHSTGTGLGLALARHFILAHGGTIEVSSREGSGSIFTVILPRGQGKREK